MLFLKNLPENALLVSNCALTIGGGVVLFSGKEKKQPNFIKKVALVTSFFPSIFFLFLLGSLKKYQGFFQFTEQASWGGSIGLGITQGVDNISIFFVLLTAFLVPMCILANWGASTALKGSLTSFLVLEALLLNAFCSLDVFGFFIFFEGALIPMFLLLGVWGSRDRKVLASYYFFMYTLFGSVFMLVSIMYIRFQAGTSNYEVLLSFKFSLLEQKVLWLAFFVAFAAKVPMVPLHLWLPEAHVEAPTSGSMLLAGVLLKLGTYGFIRFSLPLFPEASFFFAPFVHSLCVIGIIYASLTAIRQSDIKRIVAYTSVAHMNVVVLGVFSFSVMGIEGSILQSLSHGFVATGLFFSVGVIYERHKTRVVRYYGGLTQTMPLYTAVFFFFTVANIGFPGTSNFIGEFLILAGLFKVNSCAAFLGATGIIFSSCYSLWLFNRIAFGNLKSFYLIKSIDLSKKEIFVFIPLVFYTLLLGIAPNSCLVWIHPSVNCLVEGLYF